MIGGNFVRSISQTNRIFVIIILIAPDIWWLALNRNIFHYVVKNSIIDKLVSLHCSIGLARNSSNYSVYSRLLNFVSCRFIFIGIIWACSSELAVLLSKMRCLYVEYHSILGTTWVYCVCACFCSSACDFWGKPIDRTSWHEWIEDNE